MSIAKSAKLSLEFSLPELPDTTITLKPTIERASNASEIFSSSSQIPSELLSDTTIHDVLATTYVWQNTVFALILLCYYFFIIYRYKQNISPLFKAVFSLKKTRNLYEVQSNSQRYLTYNSIFLCILTISTYVLTLIRIPDGSDPFALIGAVVASVLVWFVYKWVVHLVGTECSSDKEAFANLFNVHNQAIGVVTIISTPVIVMTAIENSYIVVATITLVSLWGYYMYRILQFFLYNGFGGLQWILYLCAVELLPISFAVAIVTRYSEL